MIDIQLYYHPRLALCNTKNSKDSGRFDYWTECISKINTILLTITPSHQSRFVPVKSTIRKHFSCKNPSTPNNILIRCWWHQIPCTIFDLSIELLRTSISPFRISQRLVNGCGDRVGVSDCNVEGVVFVWLCDIVL